MANTITVIGLGPGDKDFLTIGAIEKMKRSTRVFLRTNKHPVVSYLEEEGIIYESFDEVYESKENFDEVYKTIVEDLICLAEADHIIYAVPGSPFVAEKTVQILMNRAEKEGIHLEFVPSVSFVEAIFHTLKKDPINGFQIVDGLQLNDQTIDVETDVLVTQVYDRWTASQVKLKLMEYYDDEHPIIVIRGAGIPKEEKKANILLYELDHIGWLDYLTSIYIPRVDNRAKKAYTINDLTKIMEKLRGKNGCPWDAEQTHKSLRPYLIEEAYEVLEALESDDMILLEEELGDLLLQVIFHATIASEQGEFHMKDVVTGICKKLIHRHPHVFGKVKVGSSSEVLKNWNEIKREEKNVKTYTDSLKRIPKHLPALMKSYKVQKKAADVGFDWDHVEDAIEKVKEELNELLEVYNTGEKNKITEELGDLLFAVVNVSRFLKVEPELALNSTIEKFISRFEFIEVTAESEGKKLENMTLEEMDVLWNKAKKSLNK